jgi:multiple sugar transport system substrate-binding protein
VPDNLSDTYGAGYLAGTVIGISKNSRQQAAAWQLVKYMTTRTDALASFAQAITNVPSTFQSLDAVPRLSGDPNFKTFLDVFASPDSGTTPTSRDGSSTRGGFDDLVKRWEAGEVRNPTAELAALDQKLDAAG